MGDKNEKPVARETTKTVTLTLEVKADNMTEVYGRLAQIVKSVENSAEVVSVDVRDKKSHGIGYRDGGLSFAPR